jgi:energy-coupling factor transporter ATP-binding protein EcfA2/energy-coupling factor transporter transmembrane protein EcfT
VTPAPGVQVAVDHLTWRPMGRKTPILLDLSFTIEPGEHVLLIGGSGSGKSTLLRALAGVLTSSESGDLAGTVTLTAAAEAQPSVGLLMQDPADAVVAGTAYRDAAFGLENEGVPREDMADAVRKILAQVTFPYGLDRPVAELSGGEAQRLALAGVLVMGPGLVLLDEPTSMLDPVAASAVRAAIRSAVLASSATVIVVEHRLEPWIALVDRVIVLARDGTLSADGPVHSTLDQHAELLQGDGIWIPGLPAPAPLDIPPALCAPIRADDSGNILAAGHTSSDGDDAVTARQVGLTRAKVSLGNGGRPVTTHLLRDANVSVRAGEVVAVVGPSGSGKSTLASLVAGLEKPTSGEVTVTAALEVKGEARPGWWQAPALAARIGWVPQNAELTVIGRTVRDDARLTERLLYPSAVGTSNRVERLLAVLSLAPLCDSDPHLLSGGEMRRLALATAVAHGPSILVLDEPTVGQDRQSWAAVVGVILAARDAGTAILVTTHDPLLIAIADRIITLPQPDAAGLPGKAISAPTRRRIIDSSGPLSLLGASFALMFGSFAITSVIQGVVGLAAWTVFFLLIASPKSIRWRRLVPGFLAVLSVGFSTWLLSRGQDPLTGATAAVRIAFFVLPGIHLASMIDPTTLGDHLAQRLRLPERAVVAATAALQQFENLADQWRQLQQSRRIRGLDGSRSPRARVREFAALTGALLVHSLYTAGRMSVAMDARGFSTARAGNIPRTWAEPAPWRWNDTVLIAGALVVAAIPVILRF